MSLLELERSELPLEQAIEPAEASLEVNLLGLNFALRAAVFEDCSSAFG